MKIKLPLLSHTLAIRQAFTHSLQSLVLCFLSANRELQERRMRSIYCSITPWAVLLLVYCLAPPPRSKSKEVDLNKEFPGFFWEGPVERGLGRRWEHGETERFWPTHTHTDVVGVSSPPSIPRACAGSWWHQPSPFLALSISGFVTVWF